VSKAEKLIQRFLSKPRDFKYTEAKKLLRHYGYTELTKGRTSGSRVAFINQKLKRSVLLHKPHKGIMKPYQLTEIKNELIKTGKITEEK